MKAKITGKSELSLDLTQHFTFDILSDDGQLILASQSVKTSPSTAVQDIKAKVLAYQEEYEKSQELPEGMEIE